MSPYNYNVRSWGPPLSRNWSKWEVMDISKYTKILDSEVQ